MDRFLHKNVTTTTTPPSIHVIIGNHSYVIPSSPAPSSHPTTTKPKVTDQTTSADSCKKKKSTSTTENTTTQYEICVRPTSNPSCSSLHTTASTTRITTCDTLEEARCYIWRFGDRSVQYRICKVTKQNYKYKSRTDVERWAWKPSAVPLLEDGPLMPSSTKSKVVESQPSVDNNNKSLHGPIPPADSSCYAPRQKQLSSSVNPQEEEPPASSHTDTCHTSIPDPNVASSELASPLQHDGDREKQGSWTCVASAILSWKKK